MTGTIDLSCEQLANIATVVDEELVRVIIHPAHDGAVRVVTRTLAYGDVLEGHFYVLRDGTRLSGKEYDEHEGQRALGRV